MKLTNNQFYGKIKDLIVQLPKGSKFLDIETGIEYYSDGEKYIPVANGSNNTDFDWKIKNVALKATSFGVNSSAATSGNIVLETDNTNIIKIIFDEEYSDVLTKVISLNPNEFELNIYNASTGRHIIAKVTSSLWIDVNTKYQLNITGVLDSDIAETHILQFDIPLLINDIRTLDNAFSGDNAFEGEVFMEGEVTLENTLTVYSTLEASWFKLEQLNTSTAPSSSTDTGNEGEIQVTADYIYVCIATNTWVRTALTTW